MATTTTSSRDLIGTESISFIRPQTLRIDMFDCRPNTKIFPFFDGVRIDEFVRPAVETPGIEIPLPITSNGVVSPTVNTLAAGGDLKTTSLGRLTAFFDIPAGKFNTGDRDIVFTDTEDIEALNVQGNILGYARAVFKAHGTTEIYQTTTVNTDVITTIVSVEGVMEEGTSAPPMTGYDPLAQSFFTYGVSGGMFLTSIDLYFQSKDETVPVSIEIRPLINGVPGPLDPNATDRIVFKNPADITISNDSSVATNFKFNVPIYLPEDSDFCFVTRSNSNKYNIWTSKMGEKSIETGYVIHEQPYVGSMFKSENNITWTPEQFEDIKFTLYKAEFDINSSAELKFTGTTPPRVVNGTQLFTKTGSNLIIYGATTFHGLQPGSKIDIGADSAANYNGIPGTSLTGSFDVTRKIDDYFVEFSVIPNATKTGAIEFCNIVRKIVVLSGGTGYTTAPTVTVGAPDSGTTATATAIILNGRVTDIIVTNGGTGYQSNPSVILTGGGGTGATVMAIAEATFTIIANTPINWISPQFKYAILPSTKISSVIESCNESYGYLPSTPMRIDQIKNLEETRMIASRNNEYYSLSNNPSFGINMEMYSTNKNVSPYIDIRGRSSIMALTNAINNQARDEDVDILVTNSTAGVTGYTITNAGTGYSSAPSVTVLPAENDKNKNNIVAAVITSSIVGGAVSTLTITNSGSGYTKPPLVIIDNPTSGTVATATLDIGTFNSELMTTGSSYSRYVTKKNRLQTVSSGIRVYVLAQSTPETTFDWYIRTSLSGDNNVHETMTWRLLNCDVNRDKSSNSTEFFEYQFYLDNVPEFDTYDMKMVPSSSNRARIPYIKRYRAIVVV